MDFSKVLVLVVFGFILMSVLLPYVPKDLRKTLLILKHTHTQPTRTKGKELYSHGLCRLKFVPISWTHQTRKKKGSTLNVDLITRVGKYIINNWKELFRIIISDSFATNLEIFISHNLSLI